MNIKLTKEQTQQLKNYGYIELDEKILITQDENGCLYVSKIMEENLIIELEQ